MTIRDRSDVHEADQNVVLIYRTGFQFTRCNLAEDTFVRHPERDSGGWCGRSQPAYGSDLADRLQSQTQASAHPGFDDRSY